MQPHVIVTVMMRSTMWLGLASLLCAGACTSKDKTDDEQADERARHAGSAAADTAHPSPAAHAQPGEATAGEPEAPATPPLPRQLTPLAPSPDEHTGAHRWSHAVGGQGTDAVRALAVDARGRVAVAGYFAQTVDFGDGRPVEASKLDAFVSTRGADGSHLWTAHFGGTGEDAVNTVAFDPAGGLVIAGLFSGTMTIGDVTLVAAGSDDAFIARLASDGTPLWARAAGGHDSDAAHHVAVDADGSVYVTGSFKSDMTVGGQPLKSTGNEDVFLLKLAPGGDVTWIRQFGGRYRDSGQRVAVDGEGNLLLLAEFTDEIAFGGPALTSEGNRDLALVKLTPAGEHLWSKRFGSPFNELGLGLAVDPAGNIAVTGSFDNEIDFGGGKLASKGESDVYVARFAPDGAHLWSKRFGAAREDIGHDIAADRYGNLAVTGWFWGEVDFGGDPLRAEGVNKDIFLLKLSADGEHLWSRRFGASDHDQGRGVAMTPDGVIALAGIFRFALDLGGEALESAREPNDKAPPPDIFVASFAP